MGSEMCIRDRNTINSVSGNDYSIPISEFEKAIKFLPTLNADEEIVDYVRKNAPKQISTIYYKWASDLFDKARQLENYGDEVKDIKQGLKFLKKTIEQAFITFERMRRGERKVYFTGNWQKDVLACFPGRQSNKVFKKMRVFLDNNKEYCFTQKKLENIEGYEYIVIRR